MLLKYSSFLFDCSDQKTTDIQGIFVILHIYKKKRKSKTMALKILSINVDI